MSRNLQARPADVGAELFPSNELTARQATEPTLRTLAPKLNAQAVELIARADNVGELRACICEHLADLLQGKSGFEGVFVMASHKEPRRLLILSLWKTQREATENPWESEPAFREMVAPMVDVCARVNTYETLLCSAGMAKKELRLC